MFDWGSAEDEVVLEEPEVLVPISRRELEVDVVANVLLDGVLPGVRVDCVEGNGG